MSYEKIEVALVEDGTVLEIVLDQAKGNVLDAAMMGEIDAALGEHRERKELRLVLLRGAGGHFSFGASVEEHQLEQAPAMLATFHGLLRRVAAYPVPIAALAEGSCLGGAFELVLCCHFLFAKAGARFGCPEIKLAVFPPLLAAVGSHRLGSLVAERLLLTGDTLRAEEAARLGFLTGLAGEDDDARDFVLAWYRKKLRPLSAFALRQGTQAVRRASGWLDALDRAVEAAERQYVDEVLASHDGNEGITAFLEKRQPAWQDA